METVEYSSDTQSANQQVDPIEATPSVAVDRQADKCEHYEESVGPTKEENSAVGKDILPSQLPADLTPSQPTGSPLVGGEEGEEMDPTGDIPAPEEKAPSAKKQQSKPKCIIVDAWEPKHGFQAPATPSRPMSLDEILAEYKDVFG